MNKQCSICKVDIKQGSFVTNMVLSFGILGLRGVVVETQSNQLLICGNCSHKLVDRLPLGDLDDERIEEGSKRAGTV